MHVLVREVDPKLVGRRVEVKLRPRGGASVTSAIHGILADVGEDFVVIRTERNKLVTIPRINIQTVDVVAGEDLS